ncbi:hypothetical protein Tco_0611149 [Tanacetum coccineum]
MASESTSLQQSQHLAPSSKVNFKCEDGIIAFNNAIALREHPNKMSFGIQQKWKKKPKPSPSYSHGHVPLPLKETVKAGLATLGLFDKDEPILSSTVLGSHDQMNLNQQTIAYCLIYKLQNRKKNMESNICYTRFLSLVFEKLLGDKYIGNDLTFVKPHTITAAPFQKPLAFEVSLTSHMLKVAKISKEPEQSLIPPSGEVNTDDTADKSLSMAFEQPVT